MLIYSGLVRNVKMTATKTKTYIARKVSLLKGLLWEHEGPHKGQVFTFQAGFVALLQEWGMKAGELCPGGSVWDVRGGGYTFSLSGQHASVCLTPDIISPISSAFSPLINTFGSLMSSA